MTGLGHLIPARDIGRRPPSNKRTRQAHMRGRSVSSGLDHSQQLEDGPGRNAAVRWSWDDAPIQSLTNPSVCVRLRRSPWTSRFGRHDSSAAAALTRRLVGSAILRPGASLRTWDTVVTESPVRTATSRKVGSRCGILASFRHYRATSTPGLVDPPLARPSVAAWSPLRSLGSSDTVYGLGTVAKWTL